MAFTVGILTLYREKSLFFDGAHPGPDLEEYARLKICSNRVTWALGHGDKPTKLVVRGHNVPSTLRLCGLIYDLVRGNPTALNSGVNTNWDQLFADASSDYDTKFNPNRWFSVYANGERLAALSEIDPAIDMLEAKAKGNEIDEIFLKKMATEITDRRSIRLRHDSTAAIILNIMSDGIRCALIDRRPGKNAGFSFKIQNPPGKRIRVSAAIHMAADIFEMQNLYAIVSRVEKVLSGELPKSAMPISLDHVEAIQLRNSQLKELIKSGHDTYDISYRPAPPPYLPPLI